MSAPSSPRPEQYARDVPIQKLRQSWNACLRASSALGAHQLLTSRGAGKAVLVPFSWYGRARQALGTAEEWEPLGSRGARPAISALVGRVASGEHIVLTSDGIELAALVPMPWHTEAVATLRPDAPLGELPPLD
ncbi:hypothetical protein [Streptomyces hydrogenans]|uniref:hypothetical protein n=1 Tax=Streptomyces hydrogenans TaxID=1873719 RepID=UPI0037F8C8A3